jgi:hypothetical protein
MHAYLGMHVLAHFQRGFGADGPITKRSTFGAAGDNSDMFCHDTLPHSCFYLK